MSAHLHPLPAQPADIAWPTDAWERAELPNSVDPAAVEELIGQLLGPDQDPAVGHTNAVAIVHRGRIVAERYGMVEEHPLAALAGVEPGPITEQTPLKSWSMAKSVCHLLVGILQERGVLNVNDPAPVPLWAGDERRRVTWDDLLQMRPGTEWSEVYSVTDSENLPDVITMLYGDAAADMAAYAADKPLVATPGSPEAYNYSSGTTNIVQGCVQRTLGISGPEVTTLLNEALFSPIGATSLSVDFDGAGHWVASSYLNLTARDWLRLGLLVLRGGTWDGAQVVPSEWIDHGRTAQPTSIEEENQTRHCAHWWERMGRDDGGFAAQGFEAQRLIIVPDRDLVVFRSGRTADGQTPHVDSRLWGIVDLFPRTTPKG